MLLLTERDLAGLLDMRTAIRLTAELLQEQAAGQAFAHEPVVLQTGGQDMRVNLGATSAVSALRVAVGSTGASLLFDNERLLAVMAYPAGYLRVGATVAIAVDRLARPDARSLVILGTGTVARSCIEGIAAVRQFERVQVFSRDPEHRAAFCAYAASFGVEAEAITDPEPAIRAADVIVLATLARQPVLLGSWLRDDAHVTTAGIRNEIDDDTYLRAGLVAVTSIEHERYYRSRRTQDNVLLRLAQSGQLPWDQIHELADVVADAVTPAGISVFRESQGGLGDVPFLHWLYQRAVELGRGQTLNFD